MDSSARRSDTKWQERYARSQAQIEHAQRLSAASEPVPNFPALSSVIAPDGTRYMLRLIPPGEPMEHVGRFAVLATLALVLSRGQFHHRSDDTTWRAVVERQKGAWRGYERVAVQSFDRAVNAVDVLQRTRHDLERPPATDASAGVHVTG